MEQPAVPCPRPMRRADREVHDTAEIEGILRDCADVRVAYQDAQDLTIVPVNFAYVLEDGKLTLFMHSALAGRKIDAIRSAGNALPVAFEMDCDAEVYTGRTPCSSTTGVQINHRHRRGRPHRRNWQENRSAHTAHAAAYRHEGCQIAAPASGQGGGMADCIH